MPAKKGQTFNKYSEETKKEAVRLRMEKKLDIQSDHGEVVFGEASESGASQEPNYGVYLVL
ncbi:hypothetical protein [Paenibacillus pabuli]|uniref:hypothetical protein n=1 Tax=Paenibacillus pabuli TaxID=1472 RepID=UPI00206AC095|nr:hypothetical protein KET34_04740 [Paenibacillus pabuli]